MLMLAPSLHADTFTEGFSDHCDALGFCHETVDWTVDTSIGNTWNALDWNIDPSSYQPGLQIETVQDFGPCSDWNCVASFLGISMPEDTIISFDSPFLALYISSYEGDTRSEQFKPVVFDDPPPVNTPESPTGLLLFTGLMALSLWRLRYKDATDWKSRTLA